MPYWNSKKNHSLLLTKKIKKDPLQIRVEIAITIFHLKSILRI